MLHERVLEEKQPLLRGFEEAKINYEEKYVLTDEDIIRFYEKYKAVTGN